MKINSGTSSATSVSLLPGNGSVWFCSSADLMEAGAASFRKPCIWRGTGGGNWEQHWTGIHRFSLAGEVTLEKQGQIRTVNFDFTILFSMARDRFFTYFMISSHFRATIWDWENCPPLGVGIIPPCIIVTQRLPSHSLLLLELHTTPFIWGKAPCEPLNTQNLCFHWLHRCCASVIASSQICGHVQVEHVDDSCPYPENCSVSCAWSSALHVITILAGASNHAICLTGLAHHFCKISTWSFNAVWHLSPLGCCQTICQSV